MTFKNTSSRGCRLAKGGKKMSHKFNSGQREGLSVLVLWSLGWKAVSLRHAARDGSKPWYSALLMVC